MQIYKVLFHISLHAELLQVQPIEESSEEESSDEEEAPAPAVANGKSNNKRVCPFF